MNNKSSFEFKLQPWEYDPNTTKATEMTDLWTMATWQGQERRIWLRAVKPGWIFFRVDGQDENWNWVINCSRSRYFEELEEKDFGDREKLLSRFASDLKKSRFGRMVIWPHDNVLSCALFYAKKCYVATTFGPLFDGEMRSFDQDDAYYQFYLENDNYLPDRFLKHPASYWPQLVANVLRKPLSDLNFTLHYTRNGQGSEENTWDFMKLKSGSRQEMEQVVKWMLTIDEARRQHLSEGRQYCHTHIRIECLASESRNSSADCWEDNAELDFDVNYEVKDAENSRWKRLGALFMKHYQPTLTTGYSAQDRFYPEELRRGAEHRFFEEELECMEEDGEEDWTPAFSFQFEPFQPTEHERIEAIVGLQTWLRGKLPEAEIVPLLLAV